MDVELRPDCPFLFRGPHGQASYKETFPPKYIFPTLPERGPAIPPGDRAWLDVVSARQFYRRPSPASEMDVAVHERARMLVTCYRGKEQWVVPLEVEVPERWGTSGPAGDWDASPEGDDAR
jgi:hypothetical protein